MGSRDIRRRGCGQSLFSVAARSPGQKEEEVSAFGSEGAGRQSAVAALRDEAARLDAKADRLRALASQAEDWEAGAAAEVALWEMFYDSVRR